MNKGPKVGLTEDYKETPLLFISYSDSSEASILRID